MAARKKILSDSDIVSGLSRNYRRESIADYLTSRRGSLSDLVNSSYRKLSRDSLLGNTRMSRNSSLTNQAPLVNLRDQKQRSSSVVTSTSLQTSQSSIRESRLEQRSNSHVIHGSFTFKQLSKTKSLNSILPLPDRGEEGKRNSKLFSTKRRRWLRKIQSLKAFETALKSRQNRRKFEVSTKTNIHLVSPIFVTLTIYLVNTKTVPFQTCS